MRETYSLHCHLVDHALALPGENNTLETSVAAVQFGPVQSKFFWTLNWTFGLVQHFA
jgi:hypothetical protein